MRFQSSGPGSAMQRGANFHNVRCWLGADSFGPRVGGPLYPQNRTSEAQERLGLKKRTLDGCRCRRRTAADIRHYQQKGVKAAQKKADERVAVIADELIPLRDQGLSLNAIAKALNNRRIQTSRGCEWTPTAVKRALARLP